MRSYITASSPWRCGLGGKFSLGHEELKE